MLKNYTERSENQMSKKRYVLLLEEKVLDENPLFSFQTGVFLEN